jgi:hypothetical protein
MSDIVHDAEYCILAGSKRGEFRRAGTSYASAPREEKKRNAERKTAEKPATTITSVMS